MKRVKSNLIEQNCYITGARPASFSPALRSPRTYPSLRETPFQSGVKHEIVQEEYPITPESVASFEDSCDYKSDPLKASQAKPACDNLGDLRSAQDLLQNMNPDDLRHFMKGFDLAYKKAVEARAQAATKNEEKENKKDAE
ncbi:hypothetical protein [Dipodfec virus UOA04_Rod_765]|nr:hypothetical protein [Dipodfec virus UOA04_Rod_765]